MSCQLEHVVLYYMWIEGGDERSGGGSGEHWMTEQRPYCAVCQCACMCVCAKEALTAVSKSPNSHKSAPPSCASPSHVLCCTSSVQIHSWAITPSIPRYKHVLVCVCVCVCEHSEHTVLSAFNPSAVWLSGAFVSSVSLCWRTAAGYILDTEVSGSGIRQPSSDPGLVPVLRGGSQQTHQLGPPGGGMYCMPVSLTDTARK